MSSLSTHVLDTSTGLPAAGVRAVLERLDLAGPAVLADERTDADGRVRALLPAGGLQAATYRLRFDTGEYFRRAGGEPFFPEVCIVFSVADAARHHHVPLLLSPYGYSTYRGS